MRLHCLLSVQADLLPHDALPDLAYDGSLQSLGAEVDALAEAGLYEPPDWEAGLEGSAAEPSRRASDDEADDPADDPGATPRYERDELPIGIADDHQALSVGCTGCLSKLHTNALARPTMGRRLTRSGMS